MTTYTTSLRFVQPVVGGAAGTWATSLNTDFALIDAAITGDNGYAGGSGGVSVAGLGSYTLTVNFGSADQSRQLLYPFVGALTGDCTVIIPGTVKIGWVLNATTGGHNIILSTGSGSTLTVAAGPWVFFYCDGTNVTAPTAGFAAVATDSVSQRNSTNGLKIGAASDKLAFFAGTPVVKATVTGSKGANAALGSLMTALAAYGLVTDTTS